MDRQDREALVIRTTDLNRARYTHMAVQFQEQSAFASRMARQRLGEGNLEAAIEWQGEAALFARIVTRNLIALVDLNQGA